jgi:hypothetical protein
MACRNHCPHSRLAAGSRGSGKSLWFRLQAGPWRPWLGIEHDLKPGPDTKQEFSAAWQPFLKFDNFGSFWGIAAQRGRTKGFKGVFLVGKSNPRLGTEVDRGT